MNFLLKKLFIYIYISLSSGPLASMLCKRLSIRSVIIVGGFLVFIGYSSCGQINNIVWMYATFSVLVGRLTFNYKYSCDDYRGKYLNRGTSRASRQHSVKIQGANRFFKNLLAWQICLILLKCLILK